MAILLAESTPISRKTYFCDACEWVAQLQERDVTPEEWATILKARAEKCKILPKTKYVRQQFADSGEIRTYRARPEIHAIALKYDLFDE